MKIEKVIRQQVYNHGTAGAIHHYLVMKRELEKAINMLDTNIYARGLYCTFLVGSLSLCISSILQRSFSLEIVQNRL
jgi:nicotinamide riboside kinase